MTPPGGSRSRQPSAPRSTPLSAARLAAVQALYQMDMTGTDVSDVVAEFCNHRMGNVSDSACCQDADADFFANIVKGVVADQKRIDPLLNTHLAEGWRLSRIDSILRAILRSAAYELLAHDATPLKVIINEYVDVAHAFFDGEEPKVVNGILDALGQELRKDEFEDQTDG